MTDEHVTVNAADLMSILFDGCGGQDERTAGANIVAALRTQAPAAWTVVREDGWDD
jgi:hypothetical protein